MNTQHHWTRFLTLLVAAFAFAFLFAVPAAAQLVPADVPTLAAPEAAPTGESSLATIVSVALALVSGLVAIWKNKEASTAKKVTASLVLGIEEATKLPQVQAAEKQIKAKIRATAEDLGVQPILHRAVRDLT